MPFGRGSLSIVLVTAMIASTFSIFALAVLASAIIDDLGVSRTMVGVIGSVNTGVGALSAPYSGKLTDRIGPRNAVLTVLVLSAFSLLLMGMSSTAWMLIAAGVVGGIPQGWGNPATNALISALVEPGGRGRPPAWCSLPPLRSLPSGRTSSFPLGPPSSDRRTHR